MSLKWWIAIAICAAATGGLLGPSSSRGQEDVLFVPAPPPDPGRRIKLEPKRVEIIKGSIDSSPFVRRVEVKIGPETSNALHDAAAKIRDAESEEAKSAAKQELTTLLNKYFEDDMAQRAKELAKVEERVKNLRALLEKRKNKKQEIINLQIKVLENEADGLGFFNNAGAPGQPGWPMFLKQNWTTNVDGPHSEFHVAPDSPQKIGASAGASAAALELKLAPSPPPPPRKPRARDVDVPGPKAETPADLDAPAEEPDSDSADDVSF